MRDNILLAFPMLELKIVFTFGSPALVKLPSGAEDINRPDFACLFINQFCA